MKAMLRGLVWGLALLGAVGCRSDAPIVPRPTPVASQLRLTASPPELLFSGSEVAITAVLTDAQGTVVADAPIEFSTTSGTLATPRVNTSSAGMADVRLSGREPATISARSGAVSAMLTLPAVAPFSLSLEPTVRPLVVGTQTFSARTTVRPGVVSPPAIVKLVGACDVGAPPIDLRPDAGALACTFRRTGTQRAYLEATTANGWTLHVDQALAVSLMDVFIEAQAETLSRWRFSIREVPFATRYEWSFGDGSRVTTEFLGLSHTFAAPGAFTVAFEAYDSGGQVSARGSRLVYVSF